MSFKQVGVEAIVKGLPSYKEGLDKINAYAAKASDGLTKTLGKNDAFKDSEKAVQTFADSVKSMANDVLSQVPVIGQFSDEILGVVSPAMLAVAALGALAVAAVGLGIQGGEIKGVADSFEVLTTKAGQTADELLGKLRVASHGTISDFQLMTEVNVALAGATGEFAKQFGAGLPKILDVARAQAKATGQSVEYLANSLITGIKRASPLLIDNTGITLKVGEANEQLAKKLGKTVESLTAEEKQIAVLNAVLAAGDDVLSAYGNAQDYANTKAVAAQVSLQNMTESIQVALEPFASSVLNIVNLLLDNVSKVVAGLLTIAQPVIDLVSSIINSVVAIISPVINFIGDTLGKLFSMLGKIAETLLAPFQVLIDILGSVGSSILGFVLTPIRSLLDFLLKTVDWIVNLARGFIRAGFTLIGALAAGILKAANEILLPAVIAVATLIADFLVGQSPPPKGPLSQIDKGGANTMEAWLQGFIGVSLDPLDQVTKQVADKMGDIAGYSMKTLEARFAQLDAALQPFQDRLNIIKAEFEALKPVTEAAFSSIDRQMDRAVQALASGDQQAAEQVRALDKQRQSLEDYVAAQQEQIDKAQIQYALAQAQQAQERVLLDIRKRELELQQTTDPAEKAKKEKELKAAKEKAGSGGAAPTPAGGGGGVDFSMPDQGGGSFADVLKGDMQSGFDLGGGQAELGKFTQGTKLLQDQFKRIGDAPLLAGIKEKLGEFSKWFDPNNPDGIIYKALQFLNYQANPANADGLVGWFANIPTNLSKAITGLGGIVKTQIVDPIAIAFNGLTDPTITDGLAYKLNLFFNGEGEGSLQSILTAPQRWFEEKVLTPLIQLFLDLWNALLGPDNVESLAYRFIDFFTGDGEGTLRGILAAPVTWFNDAILMPFMQLFTDLYNSTLDPNNVDSFAGKAVNFFTGTGAGTLHGFLDPLANFFKDAIANPFIDALNNIIAALEMFINEQLLGALKGLAKTFQDFLASLGDTGSDIYQRLQAFAGTNIQLGRIPRLEKGGLLGSGIFQTGERGREVGMSAAPFAMFSNQFVGAIDKFASVMAQPLPLPVSNSSSYVTNSQSTMYNTFNGVSQPQEVARRIAMLRASK